MREEVYLSLGTNLGDREANLKEAIARLDRELGEEAAALSSVIETAAWGFEGPDFLNMAALYRTEKTPREILQICKKIEYEMGRRESLEYGPDGGRIYHSRIIDIDILLYGGVSINEPDLKIPHPMIEKRPFVKGPLEELKGKRKI